MKNSFWIVKCLRVYRSRKHMTQQITKIFEEHVDYFSFNPLNIKLNPICHLLALLGTHHILHVSRIRVKL